MKRIQLIHPEGKKAPSIDKSKYDTLRQYFLSALQKRNNASFDELLSEVEKNLKQRKITDEGKLQWNLFWVTLDLEAKKEIIKDRTSSPIKYLLPC